LEKIIKSARKAPTGSQSCRAGAAHSPAGFAWSLFEIMILTSQIHDFLRV